MADVKLTQKGMMLPFTTPFTRSALIAVTDKGLIFTSWNENFLIKVYDKKGDYQRAFYYPYKKSSLKLSRLDISDHEKKYLNKVGYPKTWPAIHTMFFDDQNRLWVFTITDSDSTYKGWILSKKGKLLAKFNWPGRRNKRSPLYKPIMLVKNGYFYTHERDLNKGTDRIVKWKIKFVKNGKE
jgi:hypothetical protein